MRNTGAVRCSSEPEARELVTRFQNGEEGMDLSCFDSANGTGSTIGREVTNSSGPTGLVFFKTNPKFAALAEVECGRFVEELTGLVEQANDLIHSKMREDGLKEDDSQKVCLLNRLSDFAMAVNDVEPDDIVCLSERAEMEGVDS